MELQWNFKHKTYDNKKVKIQAAINTALEERKERLSEQIGIKAYELRELKAELKLINSYINNQSS